MKMKICALMSLLLCGHSLFAQEEKTNNDWANLERYRQENAKIRLPNQHDKRILFMGDSITEFWSIISPDFFSDKPYINRGISGQTTPQMLLRFRQDVINLKPAAVIILGGTNDIAGNTGPSTLEMIEDNLKSMAEIACSNGIKVILSSVLPAYEYKWNPGIKPAEKILTLNKWLKKYASEKGFIYIDFHSHMADMRNGLKAEYSSDGVHPNKDGYALMALLTEKAIAEAMRKKL